MSYPNDILHEEPMSRHTSLHVGGPAEIFFKPTELQELEAFLRDWSANEGIYFVGLGSNLLVRDAGVRGAVVVTTGLPKTIEKIDSRRVRVLSGVPCARFARRCMQWQLVPSSFFAGIPGTIGGALAMNAGAFGGETWNNIESVETVDILGQRHTRRPKEFHLGYRSVVGRADEWFVAATFRFESDSTLGPDSIKDMLARRAAKQPLAQKTCGSVFRNPAGDFAGRLIDEAGLKGLSCGGAHVSDVHANFIVNDGTATAANVEQLIEVVRQRVEARTGITMELEARVIGDRRAA